jgi:uncharacterized protein YqiB (DUF1249 family)
MEPGQVLHGVHVVYSSPTRHKQRACSAVRRLLPTERENSRSYAYQVENKTISLQYVLESGIFWNILHGPYLIEILCYRPECHGFDSR